MAKIKILIKGYARRGKGSDEYASSTVTLIQDYGFNIIVDPGLDRALLLQALKNHGLAVADINYVILTHYHLDHILLAGIFERARILDGEFIYSFEGKILEHQGRILGINVKIINTPGHAANHKTVLVNTANYGQAAIVGDVFWRYEDQEQKIDQESLLLLPDPYAEDMERLKESRKKVLKIADYLVPGHGKSFRVVDLKLP